MVCVVGFRDIVYFMFGDVVSCNLKNGNDMINLLWKLLKMIVDYV